MNKLYWSGYLIPDGAGSCSSGVTSLGGRVHAFSKLQALLHPPGGEGACDGHIVELSSSLSTRQRRWIQGEISEIDGKKTKRKPKMVTRREGTLGLFLAHLGKHEKGGGVCERHVLCVWDRERVE